MTADPRFASTRPVEHAARIAVILPCFNEAAAIGQVIRDFRDALPTATIHVFDNASTDLTRQEALAAGASLIVEYERGKGHVVRRMFADVDADIYVMADGDGTYDASAAPMLIAHMLREHADMAIGARIPVHGAAFPKGHSFGNALFNRFYRLLFGGSSRDIFSGYRIMTRRFVKSFPAISRGFEIETELSVHAGQLNIPTVELGTRYQARGAASESKLRTFADGFRIAYGFLRLARETRPMLVYGSLAFGFAALALILTLPIFRTYLATGLVPRFPTAILATGLMLLSAVSLTCGLILQSLTLFRIEQKRILYLGLAGPPSADDAFSAEQEARSANQAQSANPPMIKPDANTKLVLRTINSE
jgi:glycosyltransferase involved in cell wall biosynthesis